MSFIGVLKQSITTDNNEDNDSSSHGNYKLITATGQKLLAGWRGDRPTSYFPITKIDMVSNCFLTLCQRSFCLQRVTINAQIQSWWNHYTIPFKT